MVRSGKIDRTRVIFRFYALYALVRKYWKTPDILDAPIKSQKKVTTAIIAVLKNNDEFASQIEETATHLENIISDSGITSREKIRDFIRTESVVDEFTKRLFPVKANKKLSKAV